MRDTLLNVSLSLYTDFIESAEIGELFEDFALSKLSMLEEEGTKNLLSLLSEKQQAEIREIELGA